MRSKMDGNDRVAVGLDLGMTKIAAVIAELEGNGRVKVIGVGSSPSEGLRRGVVVDVEKTVGQVFTPILHPIHTPLASTNYPWSNKKQFN